jgi:thiol-disulfide isomerase/thioredoxin
MLHNENDTLYIINFWATWCKPCVAELPYFEKLNKIYASEKLKIILVSLDFSDELETRVMPFILKNNIHSKVFLLNESNPNTFIDKISPRWSGAIPATYIYKGNVNSFYEKSFNYEELESIVKLKLNE